MPQLTTRQAFDMALQHHQAGRLAEAENLYRQILAREPRQLDAMHFLGLLANQLGRSDAAIELIRNAIRMGLNIPDAHSNLGNALRATGQLDEAIASFHRALALNPNMPGVYLNLGMTLREKGRHAEAIAAYHKAITIDPDIPAAHHIIGNALKDQGLLVEAIAAFRQAIRFQPDLAEAHNDLGSALTENGQLEEAITAYAAAMALKPDYPEAHRNLGVALRDQGMLDDAIAAFDRAIRLNPAYADAHWDLATTALLQGDFLRGWQEYEWRWKVKNFPSPFRNFSKPLWDGSNLGGRTILLHAEQGFGDTIQFLRYVPMVADRGGKILVECPVQLKRLLQVEPHGWTILASGEPLPEFDVQCPLLSLPLICGTSLHNIPASVRYIHIDPQLAAKWRGRLAGFSDSLKVGLVWAGNPAFKNDRNRSPRELPLFSPLAKVKNVQFLSLQKGDAAQQTANPPAGMKLIDWSAELHDFAETAALIANLDLVISSDTAVAHLAGALAKPVWVMLSFSPDFRWLLDRVDCPWYPTMRLYRQPRPGDWNDVIQRLGRDLAHLPLKECR